MVKRKIVEINEEKCTGCGLCIPECPEGALQIIDGKARLVSDLFCDGLGACLGHCPEGAINIVEREAETYSEKKVMANIVKAGANTIKAHLEHLRGHGEKEYLKQALEYLSENDVEVPEGFGKTQDAHACAAPGFQGCPGSRMLDFSKKEDGGESGDVSSQLRQWPVQLHLVNPLAPYFMEADVVLAADCVAFALGNFHTDWLKGKGLAIACPKLDSGMDVYVEKIKAMIDDAKINTLTVMRMQVPCCGGLTHIAETAVEQAERKIPVKEVVVSVEGEILSEQWL